MPTYTNTEAAMEEIREAIETGMENGGNVSVKMEQKREKMNFVNPFVVLFHRSLLEIINEFNLTKMEIKAILKILDYMEFGNLVRMSYSQLMRDIGSDTTNGSKVIKRLKAAKIIIEEDGNTFLNPHIIAKGMFRRNDASAQNLLRHAGDELAEIGISPSIMANGIKNDMKKNG